MGLVHNLLRPRRRGDRLTAHEWNIVRELLAREIRGINVMSDATGWNIWNDPLPSTITLARLMLAENHPGWSEVFMCYKGVWNSLTTCWDFDCDDDCDNWVYAIDWFWGGDYFTYPDAGATGIFWEHPSDDFGTIWECVSMDCEAYVSCDDQGGSGTLSLCGSGSGTCWGSGTGTGTGT